MPERASPQIPIQTCASCGGDWFRIVDFYEFLNEKDIRMWPTWPLLTGQLSPGPLSIGICLCGMPWLPVISGSHNIHWTDENSWTSNVSEIPRQKGLEQFLRCLGLSYRVHDQQKNIFDVAGREWVKKADLDALRDSIKRLSRQVGKFLRPTGKGSHWEMPHRQPEAPGRDQLIL